MHPPEEYILKLLVDTGCVSRLQIDEAKARLNGNGDVVDLLIKDGCVAQPGGTGALVPRGRNFRVDIRPM